MSNSKLVKNISTDSRLPDYGNLEIDNFQIFLDRSKSKFNERWNMQFDHKENLNDFEQLTQLGKGGFGNVILVKQNKHNDYYAMKCILKETIIKHKQLENSKTEKKVLQSLDFPMTVYLNYFFKDDCYIYLVMPFITGGDLFTYHRSCEKFDEVQSRFYTSQIVLALEYLHHLDLIYRDLKPENILIDHTGYLKLIDFGFCKPLRKNRTYTFCGTPEYVAPEIILNQGYGQSVDWWALGIILYEMVAGKSPFCANDAMQIYNKVVASKYIMPRYFSYDLQNLVRNLLKPNLSKRFGNLRNGSSDIKDHLWFRPINWMAILNRKVKPPYKPASVELGEVREFSKVLMIPCAKDKYSAEFEDF